MSERKKGKGRFFLIIDAKGKTEEVMDLKSQNFATTTVMSSNLEVYLALEWLFYHVSFCSIITGHLNY